MKLPALNDLIPEQKNVYLHPADQSLFVAGPPGSGKTTVAVYRAQFLANNAHSVTLVTKNRMLVALAEQLGGPSVQAITMQRLVWGHYRAQTRKTPPRIGDYAFDWAEILRSYRRAKVTPEIGHLVVDEAQNLPPGFFAWARFAARHLDVFADEHQALDDVHSTLKAIRDGAGLPEPVRLIMNHRNTPEIADLAKHFHGPDLLLPPARVKKGRSGELPRLIEVDSLDDLAARAVTRLRNRAESIGVIVRTGKEVTRLAQLLRAKAPRGERVDAYTKDTARGAERGIKLLDRGVTVLTGEAVIGLEFDTVYLLDLARSLPCRTATARRRMYMLCARARESLFLVNGPVKLRPAALAALPSKDYLAR